MNSASSPQSWYRRGVVIILAPIIAILVAGVWWARLFPAAPEYHLLIETDCRLPCWSGITPGLTNSTEALQRIGANPDINQTSLQQIGDSTNGDVTWNWLTPARRMLPGIVWHEGTVRRIELGVPNAIPLQESIAKLGEPEAVVAIMGGQPEHWYWIVTLYYPRKGVELSAYLPEFSDQLTEETPVEVVVLFEPVDLGQRIADKFTDPDVAALETRSVRPWRGFGSVVDLYNPEDIGVHP